MIQKTLIGYRKFNSKAGKACCIVSLLSDYSQGEISYGAVGQKCEDIFLPDECHKLIVPTVVGKTCSLQYGEGFNGKPAVIGIEIQK
ncbi:MAG: hypothetical protein NC223_06795 [Butyrivibrio sp.]|nr:hypothetical protein [Butyrivibrio sp.]